ncbi:hypothetical protein IB024_01590 [Brucella sp. 6810]|uniref:hypothetical protein n=1 Tax=Brucella sp. 6810 TaxID=2769351 RepID=UPI00165BB245|nr:hypothetical protein [Brucella sp. 6810]QNQ62477.1 hypothetical protein IB024_01590 [Brucella sp. 6810]
MTKILSTILDRLSKLDAPDREVDAGIDRAFGLLVDEYPLSGPMTDYPAPVGYTETNHYTASVDAAIALAERVLPESVARRLIVFNSSPAKAGFDGTPERGRLFYFEAATPAIAACIALLHAKEVSKL